MPAVGEGVDLEVFFVHPVEPGLIQLVGVDDVLEVLDRLQQCGRFVVEGNLHERFLELAHRVEADVFESVGEHLHMRRTDLARHGGFGHQRQIP